MAMVVVVERVHPYFLSDGEFLCRLRRPLLSCLQLTRRGIWGGFRDRCPPTVIAEISKHQLLKAPGTSRSRVLGSSRAGIKRGTREGGPIVPLNHYQEVERLVRPLLCPALFRPYSNSLVPWPLLRKRRLTSLPNERLLDRGQHKRERWAGQQKEFPSPEEKTSVRSEGNKSNCQSSSFVYAVKSRAQERVDQSLSFHFLNHSLPSQSLAPVT